ncbi:hypothetical protein WJX82_009691 [Trebouxia sp. C0006]
MRQAYQASPPLSPTSQAHALRPRFDGPRGTLGRPPATVARHLWTEQECSAALEAKAAPIQSTTGHAWKWGGERDAQPCLIATGQSQSDTSNTSMDSTDTATMHNHEGVHPAGTHSNPIPSSVLTKPTWPLTPPIPPQSAPQEGSMSRPLASSLLTPPKHLHSHISYAERTPSAHFYETPQGNKMTFVPTAQTPNPSQAHPKAGLTAPQGASLPPTIQQAAAATAAAATQAASGLRNRRRASSVDRQGRTGVASGRVDKARSSRFRGVTKHRRSGRWEAHIWVKELGRQVYLGGYEHEEHAAEAYDVAALKCKGFRVKTNFDADRYSDLTECMDSISLEELIMAVRRQSQGFSRGTSAYRGVTHHPSGRWEARIGIPGSKHIYLGLFNQEKEAAQAYDRALVRLRGMAAATNFALSDYRLDLAEYHKMQTAVLQSDKDLPALLGNGHNYERWIKHGSGADDVMTKSNSNDSDEPLPVGTAAGVGGLLRARVGRKSRSRSRSRSPPGDGSDAQTDQEHHDSADGDHDEPGDWPEAGVPHKTRSGRTVISPKSSGGQ